MPVSYIYLRFDRNTFRLCESLILLLLRVLLLDLPSACFLVLVTLSSALCNEFAQGTSEQDLLAEVTRFDVVGHAIALRGLKRAKRALQSLLVMYNLDMPIKTTLQEKFNDYKRGRLSL